MVKKEEIIKTENGETASTLSRNVSVIVAGKIIP